MGKMKPNTIRFSYIENILDCQENLKSMGEQKFGKEWKGFLKETSYIYSKGFITKKIEPIKGTPTEKFRELAKKCGLMGKDLFAKKQDGEEK